MKTSSQVENEWFWYKVSVTQLKTFFIMKLLHEIYVPVIIKFLVMCQQIGHFNAKIYPKIIQLRSKPQCFTFSKLFPRCSTRMLNAKVTKSIAFNKTFPLEIVEESLQMKKSGGTTETLPSFHDFSFRSNIECKSQPNK